MLCRKTCTLFSLQVTRQKSFWKFNTLPKVMKTLLKTIKVYFKLTWIGAFSNAIKFEHKQSSDKYCRNTNI